MNNIHNPNGVQIGFAEILMGLLFAAVGFITGLIFGGIYELTGGGFAIGVIVGIIKRDTSGKDDD